MKLRDDPRISCAAATGQLIWVNNAAQNWGKKIQGETPVSEIIQFIAVAVDVTNDRLVAGESFKCASPASAIDHAKCMWKEFGHVGAMAFVRTRYPETKTTVLRIFGNVPIGKHGHP